ncbi:alginate export family protein [Aquimonas voraii]|uniref:Alginate export n=1 Tax=Aquimonas voraii TaxID=265719 RepID=A0A1G6VGX7_9GAMM|nr:alginate export family protein [Aquimonas voraii]SDD52872.1 Alginate export [Aquimonas voraii]
MGIPSRPRFAPLRRLRSLLVAVCAPLSAAAQPPNPTTTADGPPRYTLGLQAGLNVVAEQNLYWNLADRFAADSGFDSDAQWLEWHLKPSVGFELSRGRWRGFGALSAVASGSRGTDAYAASNASEIDIEEAHLGAICSLDTARSLEASLGPRALKFGTGMLFSNGGSNGFERGALKLGPRKSWDQAPLLRLHSGARTYTLTRLSPNELDSGDNDNRAVVLDGRHDGPDGAYFGITAARVSRSQSPYPQAGPPGAPPAVLPGARRGLELLDAYGRSRPWHLGSGQLAFTGEWAIQRNTHIDLEAWAARVQAEWRFPDGRGAPRLLAGIQQFSGDDPRTAALERFDPLFYEGSPAAWASGSKSAMVFINSNLRAYNLALTLSPRPRDTVTLRYAHVRAHRLFSPLQFGQATRPDFANGASNIIAGVTDPHLSDDLFVEYLRIASRQLYVGAGLSVSIPGRGIRLAAADTVPRWTGAYLNVVFNY